MKEKRTHPRLDDRGIIRITVLEAPEETGLVGRQLFSLSRDISGGGLSFSVHTAPPIGAALRLSLSLSSSPRTVKNLVGRVAWVEKIPGGAQYMVGIDLGESPDVALQEWKKMIARQIAFD